VSRTRWGVQICRSALDRTARSGQSALCDGVHGLWEEGVPLKRSIGRNALALIVAVSATGCGSDTWTEPVALVIRTGDESVTVSPHSYSGPGFVADGPTIPPDGPAIVVDSRDVVIEYPDVDWTFTLPPGVVTGATLEDLGEGRWRLVPPSAAGTYEVWLEGHDNDDARRAASFVFRWVVETG
jgi:hypothetical protein